ncbi:MULTISPECIES: hypothetical protein [Vibrio]|uniref:Uncharacterized protein n=1 Tax=Vibrio cortegadensis TaxID=1328770 RepID=A0ABV4M4R3_9VIBR|nr:hypothetical protein [Vibrio cortegadensis]MDN3696098.1 hypothetical protein [Vibrio cortegadensis]
MLLKTTNEAVKELFGVEGSEPLRSKANSYLRNKVIPPKSVVEEGFSDASMGKRGKKRLNSNGVNSLFNALVLDAFFNDPKIVKDMFGNRDTRTTNGILCEEVLLTAQSVVTKSQLTIEAQQFLGQLRDTSFDLQERRLVCPFGSQRLPQMDMTLQNTGLLYHMLRSHRLSLSWKDNILLSWLEQDLSTTAELVEQVDPSLFEDDSMLKAIVHKVRAEYKEAKIFQSLLNSLPE